MVALTLGCSLGGVVLGGLLACLSILSRAAPAARAGTTLAVTAAAGLGLLAPRVLRWLPDRECQVGKYFLYSKGHTRVAFRWGIELGTAVCTFFVTPALMAMLALGAAQESALSSLWVGTVYGATRGLAMFLFTTLIANGHHSSPAELAGRVAVRSRLPLLVLTAGATVVVVFSW